MRSCDIIFRNADEYQSKKGGDPVFYTITVVIDKENSEFLSRKMKAGFKENWSDPVACFLDAIQDARGDINKTVRLKIGDLFIESPKILTVGTKYGSVGIYQKMFYEYTIKFVECYY